MGVEVGCVEVVGTGGEGANGKRAATDPPPAPARPPAHPRTPSTQPTHLGEAHGEACEGG